MSQHSFELMEEEIRRFERDLRGIHHHHVMHKYAEKRRCRILTAALERWMAFVREANAGKMEADRLQWTLHAASNADRDLQAWYHATFAEELYRLRGPFWFKEAPLPDYKEHPVTETTKDAAVYAAMAATMYTVRAMLGPKEYQLFETLTTSGAVVLKHPFRTGRPQKKRFQCSLVQGDAQCRHQSLEYLFFLHFYFLIF